MAMVHSNTDSGTGPMVWLLFTAGPVAVLAGVARLDLPAVGWGEVWHWLEVTPPEIGLLALAGAAVRVAAVWVLASTVATGMALLAGRPGLANAVSRLAVPAVRSMAVRLAAVTLAVSPSVAPVVAVAFEPAGATASVMASEPDPLLPPFLLPPPVEPVPPGSTAAPDPGSGEPPPPSRPAPAPPFLVPDGGPPRSGTVSDPAPASAAEAARHTVVHGDHLWSIAGQRLAAVGDGRPGQHDIARYWLRVIEANRETIRSGDPDLIYPGEVIRLPPIGTG